MSLARAIAREMVIAEMLQKQHYLIRCRAEEAIDRRERKVIEILEENIKKNKKYNDPWNVYHACIETYEVMEKRSKGTKTKEKTTAEGWLDEVEKLCNCVCPDMPWPMPSRIMLQGWECSRCGRVNAPHVLNCTCM